MRYTKINNMNQNEYILDMYLNEELSEDDILDLYEYGYISEDVLYSISENLSTAKKAPFIKKTKKVLRGLGGAALGLGTIATAVKAPIIPGTTELGAASIGIPSYKYIKRGLLNYKNSRKNGKSVYNSLKSFNRHNLLSSRFDVKNTPKEVKRSHHFIRDKTNKLIYHPKVFNKINLASNIAKSFL